MKDMYRLISKIVLNAVPVLVMIEIIPLIGNDIYLAGIFIAIAALSLWVAYEHLDLAFYFFGVVIVTFFEYLFVSTGVETFTHRTLFGVMPLWLPFLWGGAFIALRRAIEAFQEYFEIA